MGASGHERLAVDDLNSTDVAGQWRERAGHCYFFERKLLLSYMKKKRKEKSNNTHALVSYKEEMAREQSWTTRTHETKHVRE